MKIIWSPVAIARVVEIAEYIKEDRLSASIKWVDSIFEHVKRLKQFPKSGTMVPEVERDDIREIIYGNYRIIYRIRIREIAILTVHHGKQILPIEEIA